MDTKSASLAATSADWRPWPMLKREHSTWTNASESPRACHTDVEAVATRSDLGRTGSSFRRARREGPSPTLSGAV